MQDYADLDLQSPLAVAFSSHGANWAKIVISVGALCGLSTSLMASLFPLPRIVYSIAGDGLLFSCLGRVSRRLGTPVWATLLTGPRFAVNVSLFHPLLTALLLLLLILLVVFVLLSLSVFLSLFLSLVYIYIYRLISGW